MKAAISSCSRAATTVIFLLALIFLLAATPAFAAVDLFVSPSSGSGTTGTPQTFVFTYTNPNGFADINAAQMYFNTQPNYVGGCSVWYDNRSNWLFLFTGGSNNSWDGPATPGTVATLNSDQCSIDASQTSVSNPTANQLAISLSVTFKPGFVGSKNVYAGMQSLENVDSGWKPVGTWTPGTLVSAGPTATASNGTGNTGTLSVKLTSPNGYAYLNAANLIVNSGLTYQNGCVLWYDRPSNGLYMWNGSGWDAPLTIGVTGTLSSAQCTVNTGTSTVVPAGNDLTLNLAITFANGFIGGGKNVYGWVGDRANADNGLYPQIATWTPASTAPSLVSVTAGSTVSVVLADVNGYSYINAANIVINKVLNWANSCTVWYDLPSNNLYLWNGGGWDISPLGAGGTTLANSQCSLNGAASTMTGAGNTLTLNLALNYTSAMTGVQNVYVWSNDKADASTGFQTSTTTIDPNLLPATVAAPTFSPAGGTYSTPQTVTLSTTTPGSSIRYTTDGSAPTTTNGTVYSGPISVNATTTISAIAYESGYTSSNVVTNVYTFTCSGNCGTVATPTFSPAAGPFYAATPVTITSATPGATIYYTTDGSTPSATNGAVYTGPVTMQSAVNTDMSKSTVTNASGVTMLKAAAIKNGMTPSDVFTGNYIIINPLRYAQVSSQVSGLAHMAYNVSSANWNSVLSMWTNYLGFDTVVNSSGFALIKINDQQYIELYQAPITSPQYQLANWGFYVTDAETFRKQLAAAGVQVPASSTVNALGNRSFFTTDPDGHVDEWVEYLPGSVTSQSLGQHMPGTQLFGYMDDYGDATANVTAADNYYAQFGFGNGSSKVYLPNSNSYLEMLTYNSLTQSLAGKHEKAQLVNFRGHDLLMDADTLKTRDSSIVQTRSTEGGSGGFPNHNCVDIYNADLSRIRMIDLNY